MFKIQVSESVSVTSDGLSYSYSLPSDGQRVTHSSLRHLGQSLIGHGSIQIGEAQGGQSVINLCERIAARFTHSDLKDDERFIVFGRGQFAVTINAAGDWTVNDRGASVRRVPGAKMDVGYCPNLAAAFELAVDRTFKASDRTIAYADVNSAYLALAESLLSDVSLIDQPHQLLAAA